MEYMDDNIKHFHRKPNFWNFLQSAVLLLLNRGIFVLAIAGTGIIIILIKLKPEEARNLLETILPYLNKTVIAGWGLGVTSVVGWSFVLGRIRRQHREEIEKLSKEKQQLKEKMKKEKSQLMTRRRTAVKSLVE